MNPGWRKVCNVPAFLMIFIPTVTLVMIAVLVYLCVRCNGGVVFDTEGNILCPNGTDNGAIIIRMCVSVVSMTLVSTILTLCAWYQWTKKRKQWETEHLGQKNWVVGEGGEIKYIFPPEVPPCHRILLPKDMPENLCLAA